MQLHASTFKPEPSGEVMTYGSAVMSEANIPRYCHFFGDKRRWIDELD